ncbi:non-heme dioxygenase and 2OG-Fe(II) oxygenase superfamily protein [Metarhizium robertsii]|uniref:Non-heme dioxygenase and 2OG-Fe(II) oxygenase superfamily protein n=1 Tax=Metarhizium robertsii TaxID=568076 RepID=A0A0A1V0C6_9HYPO|nr:non-heme dioxygenase and 2OG-Fe(II) oxygenase superfamily protein [Metarhizium robertsii]
MATSTTIDFSLYLEGTDQGKRQVAKAFVSNLKRDGFAKLQNHGVPPEVVSQIWDWGRLFFNLPEDKKKEVLHVPGPSLQRGWSMVGSEITSNLQSQEKGASKDEDKLDQKEHFDCGPHDDKEYPNRWPDLPGFRKFMEQYYGICQQKALEILAMVELGLEVEPDLLTNLCRPATSELRIVHYAPIKPAASVPPTYKRAWPHSDLGVLTLLFQGGGVDGLEFEDRSHLGSYKSVTFEHSDDLLVNVSDTLARWTNDVLPAGVHQVSLPTATNESEIPERFSSAFFLKARRSVLVSALPAFVSPDNPAKYQAITALEYQTAMTKKLGESKKT